MRYAQKINYKYYHIILNIAHAKKYVNLKKKTFDKCSTIIYPIYRIYEDALKMNAGKEDNETFVFS